MSAASHRDKLKSFPSCMWLEKSSFCSRSTFDQLTLVRQIKISRLTVFEACFLHLSTSRDPVSFTFPVRSLITPSSVLGEFPSETHPDFSLILTSPSVTFPPLCSLYCVYSSTALSLSLIFFISPPLSLITLLISAPIVINLTVWYGTAWIEMRVLPF